MIVYIQAEGNMPYNKNFAYAYYGFKEMGFEIKFFQTFEDLKEINKEDIVVGVVAITNAVLAKYGIKSDTIDYPKSLNKYLGRKTWVTTLNELDQKANYPLFIKPLEPKLFTDFVAKDRNDLYKTRCSFNEKIYCSEVVNFKSEYRVFVRYGKVLDVKHYSGSWKYVYDSNIITNCLNDYKEQPSGFTLDFGVTDDGRTLLIEVNDAFSLGCYGLDPLAYAKLLETRWAELTKKEDECDFLHEKNQFKK